MIDFSKKKYILVSFVPIVNMLFWIFMIFYMIYMKSQNITGNIIRIVFQSFVVSLILFMIPQNIMNICNISTALREILDFVNISLTISFIDLNTIRIIKNRAE